MGIKVQVVIVEGGANAGIALRHQTIDVFYYPSHTENFVRARIGAIYDEVGDPNGDDPLPENLNDLIRLMADCYDVHIAIHEKEVRTCP